MAGVFAVLRHWNYGKAHVMACFCDYRFKILQAKSWIAIVFLLVATACGGLESVGVISPGSTNAPGPIIEESIVAFRWPMVSGATDFHLVIRDLDNGEVEDQKLSPATLFNSVELIGGHRYLWHISALAGTNVIKTSYNYYFSLAVRKVLPIVSGVAPVPVPSLDGAQVLMVNGKEFRRGCSVVLRDKTTGERFSNLKVALRRSFQLVVTPNFTKSEGPWSVEVVNPGGYSSGEYIFEVVAPEHLSRWQFWRSGWPWAWSIFLAFVILCIGFWRYRRVMLRTVAQARQESSNQAYERLARDLHDSLNNLSQLNLLIGSLKALVDKSPLVSSIREVVDKIALATIEAINALEDMIWAHRHGSDSLFNLLAHLREKFGRFREFNPGIHCKLDFPLTVPDRCVTSEVSQHLARFVSESLQNITKHARATKVSFDLEIRDGSLYFTIADNGRGFSPNSVDQGRGLSNLHFRASELGSHLDIESEPGSGTRVILKAPLESPDTGDIQQ